MKIVKKIAVIILSLAIFCMGQGIALGATSEKKQVEEKGTIGNTSEGATNDTNGTDATLCSYAAKVSLKASIIKVKIKSVDGNVKCAVYSDNNGMPGKLLKTTAEKKITKPGWASFNLTGTLSMNAGNVYWLAVWSDYDDFQIFADSEGPGRYTSREYGSWPISLANSETNDFTHCIYVEGTVVKNTPMVETVSIGKPVTANNELEGNPASSANDLDPSNNSLWGGSNYLQTWQIDLKFPYKLNDISIRNFVDGKRYYKYDIEGSVDNKNWVKLASKTNNKVALDEGDSYDTNKVARYLRVKIGANSANKAVHISDFSVNAKVPLAHAQKHLDLQTYDGSGQATHPDMVYFKEGWKGYKYWMAVTPYYKTTEPLENPSILASNDGNNWVVPEGVTNPLVKKPDIGHNCDCDMIYNAAVDELWIYYVEANDVDTSRLYLLKSKDGVQWSEKKELFWLPGYQILGQTIEYNSKDKIFYMWYIDNDHGKAVRRSSTDGEVWSTEEVIFKLNMPGTEYTPWHLDVKYIPSKNEYWMVFNALIDGNPMKAHLFYARSTDGLKWETYNKPILTNSIGDWQSSEIYRSSLVYDAENDMLRLWYSASNGSDWYVGYTENNYTKFMDALLNR